MVWRTEWSLKGDDLTPLRTIYERLEPADPIERHAWLFGGPTFDGVADWHTAQEKYRTAQRVAVEDILSSASLDAVIAMARAVRLPRDMGHAIATSAVTEAKKDELLERALGDKDDKLADFSFGMLFALRQARGDDWLRGRFTTGVAVREDFIRSVRMAFALPADRQLWDDIEKAGLETEQAYWKHIDDHAIPESADPAFVIGKLFAAQRGAAALTRVAAHPRIALTSELIVAILRHPSTKDASRLTGGATMYQHYVLTLFKRLDDDPSASIQEVIGLEWTYYRMLEHSERPARRLQRALATDPSFFVYLLNVVYPPEGDDHDHGVVVSEDSKKIASQAYRVLSDWTVVPGSDDAGDIDEQYLREWVGEVRKLAKESRLVAVAESRIGSILAKAARKPSSVWPPTAVQRIIETSKSDELESGFYLAERNARGVTIRRPTDGDSLERNLAAAFRSEARSIGAAQVRTRALLNRLAESYEREADGEDQSAEQRDW